MNKAIKKQWIKALRSGEYKQNQGALRDGDSFCCLGVLCNLHAQAHPEIAEKQESKLSYMGSQQLMHREVADWAGIPGHLRVFNGITVDVKLPSGISLAELNDMGKSFKQIANLIDRHL